MERLWVVLIHGVFPKRFPNKLKGHPQSSSISMALSIVNLQCPPKDYPNHPIIRPWRLVSWNNQLVTTWGSPKENRFRKEMMPNTWHHFCCFLCHLLKPWNTNDVSWVNPLATYNTTQSVEQYHEITKCCRSKIAVESLESWNLVGQIPFFCWFNSCLFFLITIHVWMLSYHCWWLRRYFFLLKQP